MLISTQLHTRSPKSTTSAFLSFSSDLRKDITWKCLACRDFEQRKKYKQSGEGRVIRVYLRRGAARNTFYLKRLGVTHVLNTAEGNRNGTVNTNQVISPPFKKKFVISFAKGLLLPVRHQVQGAEAAGRSSAEHFPAFPRGRRLHRRGPG